MPSDERSAGRGQVIGDGLSWLARWSVRLVGVALGAVLIGLIIGQLWAIVFPVLLGLIVATVLEPPATWLRQHGLPPVLSAAIVIVGALAVIGGVIALIMPSVIDQVPVIVSSATGGIEQVQAWLSRTFGIGQTQIGQAVQAAVDQMQSRAGQLAGTVVSGLSSVANGLVNAVLAVVLAFLFIKDGHRFLPWLRRQVGVTAGAHFAEVSRRSWNRLGGFIRSQAVIGLADAVFIGIGLVALGVPLALPLAVLTFFGAFIPIVGALVAGALSVLIALVVNGFTNALLVLVLILAVQQIEGNLLQPIVQGRGLGLHAAVVILAVTAGSSVAGIAGAFLAVPVTAVAAEIARYVNQQIDGRTAAAEEHPSEAPEAAPATGEQRSVVARLFRRGGRDRSRVGTREQDPGTGSTASPDGTAASETASDTATPIVRNTATDTADAPGGDVPDGNAGAARDGDAAEDTDTDTGVRSDARPGGAH